MQSTAAPGLAFPVADRRLQPPRISSPTGVVELADEQDFLRQVQRECLLSRRDAEVLAVLRLQVNVLADAQAHGQPGPDASLHADLLRECARRLRSRVRATDAVVSWQGGHFGVFLRRCEAVHAPAVLERLTRFAGGHYRLPAQLLQLQVQGTLLRCEDV